jgi:hypothetical protein
MSPCFKGLSSDQHALSMAYAVPLFSHLPASSKLVCNKRETRTSRADSRPLPRHRRRADSLVEDYGIVVPFSSAFLPKDGVIGRPSLWIAEEFWVLHFRLMVKRGPW